MRRPALALLLASVALSACAEPSSLLEPEGPQFSGAPVRETITFAATALCGPDTGEHIAFGGVIENQVHETTDARGKVHRHRIFRARGMTGTGVSTGTAYDVIGGAEMFSWQFDEQGQLRILIHQGTLVFATADHQIIARHIIRTVPGRETLNTWVCRRVAD